MITRTPPISERAEYIDLTVHAGSKLAELRFARPSGAIIAVTIPLDQLSELQEDIRQQDSSKLENDGNDAQ